jgi:cytosine/adenosine deaminase-related metal-dependent hydrolase
MDYVYGKIYQDGGFYSGYLGFEEGVIKIATEETSEKIKNQSRAAGLIIPSFYNSHLHLADAFLYGTFGNASISDLVSPKTGLKIKKLKSASDETIINGSRKAVEAMQKTGTSTFVDFREMGARGLELLERTLADSPLKCISLGRPSTMESSQTELTEILDNSDGIGLSAVCDWPYESVRKIAEDAKTAKKLFALHASEEVREDIDSIIELNPDYIVHLLEATRDDFKKVAEHDIPVVVCPRANMFFGKYPDITGMIKSKLKLALGTDNTMLVVPDMLAELAFSFRIAKLTGGISVGDMMKIIFDNPREIFEPENEEASNPLKPESKANFIVLDVPDILSYPHPENLLCLGISSAQIILISVNKFICEGLNNNR